MRSTFISIAIVILACGAAQAQEFSVGDTVRLIERDIDIPAHSAAGDNSVPFRFVGGSTALILAIDPPTGWIQIDGEVVGGAEGTGWIVERYIAQRVEANGPGNGSEPPSPQLAWCPEKGSPDPHPSGRLRIGTWNLGNLHALDGQSTFTGNDPSVKRFGIDYERIRCYVRLFDPDILAVQEVESYVRKLVTELSGGVFGYLDSVLERHSFDEFGELI